MNEIARNSPVTLTASGQGGSWGQALASLGLSSGVPELQGAIETSLRNYGLAPISVDLRATNTIPAPVWPWVGTIVIRPSYDTDSDALRDSVSLAIQDASGHPAAVAWNATGNVDDADARNNDNSGRPQWMADLFDLIQKDATYIAIGGVGLVALIVIAVAYGPNVKKLVTL